MRTITGTNKATSTAAVDAEMGIISPELATAIKVMQWWARMRAYPSKAPIRRTVAGLTKRELRRVRRSDKSNRFARRIIVAAAMVFGAEDAARAIEDDSSSNAASIPTRPSLASSRLPRPRRRRG